MTDFSVDRGELRAAGQELSATSTDFAAKADALFAQVSDVSVLGTNDTLGSLASMLYGLALERVRETVESSQTTYAFLGNNLSAVAGVYETVEEDHVQAAEGMV